MPSHNILTDKSVVAEQQLHSERMSKTMQQAQDEFPKKSDRLAKKQAFNWISIAFAVRTRHTHTRTPLDDKSIERVMDF